MSHNVHCNITTQSIMALAFVTVAILQGVEMPTESKTIILTTASIIFGGSYLGSLAKQVLDLDPSERKELRMTIGLGLGGLFSAGFAALCGSVIGATSGSGNVTNRITLGAAIGVGCFFTYVGGYAVYQDFASRVDELRSRLGNRNLPS